jgi:hypothetical protein
MWVVSLHIYNCRFATFDVKVVPDSTPNDPVSAQSAAFVLYGNSASIKWHVATYTRCTGSHVVAPICHSETSEYKDLERDQKK